MQILVIGIAGFIGSHVAPALAEEGVANFVAWCRDYTHVPANRTRTAPSVRSVAA